MADAGWYPDPQDPNSEHYWDGLNWSGQRRPAGSAHRYPPVAQASWPAQPPTYHPPQSSGPQNYQPPWFAGSPAVGGSPRKRSRKIPLIVVGVVVVLIAAGLITWLVRPSSQPSLTYQGQEISAPADVLTTAESAVEKTVTARHGAMDNATRCYFARPMTVASGAKSSDVDSSLRCGPVLFVDGNAADQYLAVPLSASATSGGQTMLTPSTALSAASPQAVGDVTLVRPDGEIPPAGAGGLTVPAPPPADQDILLATTLGSTDPPPSLNGSTIVGKYSRVTLTAAGEIPRYGSGAAARSAPSGERLIAFQVTFGKGEVDGSDTDQAQVYVNGQPRDIPTASGDVWDVVAVPKSGVATIEMTDDHYTQTLALPSGKVGSGNIAVLTRKNRTGLVGKSFDVPIRLSRSGEKATVIFHAQATVSNLYFWAPGHANDFPSSSSNAYLAVRLNYTDADDAGKTFGFDPAVLQLRLPSGAIVPAQNLAGAGRIFNVFEVPAGYTTGTLSITGSEKVAHGITLSVSRTKSFKVRIHAG